MKTKILFGAFILIALLMQSCEDFLTLEKPGEFTDDTYFVNEKAADQLLIGCYSINRQGWPFTFLFSYSFMADIRSADAIRAASPLQHDAINVASYSHQQQADHPQVLSWWNYFYDGIGRSNIAIDKIKDIPVTGDAETGFSSLEVKNRMLAEARCLRANYYSYLTKLWGDVVLIKEPLSLEDYKIPQSPQADVFDLIFEDCAFASAHLPRKNGITAGRTTKGLAMFLWVQNLVYEAGTDPDHENWEIAYQIADSLVNGSLSDEYHLLDNYGEIWMEGNDFNDETIYEVVSTLDISFRHDYLAYVYPRFVKGTDGSRKACWGFGSVAATQDLVDAFETHGNPGDTDYWEDPRLQYSVWREGDIVPIGTVEGSGKGVNDSLPVWLGDAFGGYYMKKYWLNNEPPSFDHAPINIKLFRFSDLILLHAECAYRTGRENVSRASLERVRERARQGNPNVLPEVTASGQALLDAIWHERRVELCLEQQRWFDVQRMGKVREEIEKQTYPLNPTEHFVYLPGRELLPIPQSEIDLNPNLTQNNGYAN